MNVSEALLQITDLTKKNLQILKVLNDSFYTKKNHLTTIVDGTSYTIPSYIALENKVNHLQDAFNNLVHASKCGEAWFNFDGNSKEIVVSGYQVAPNTIDLIPPKVFKTSDEPLFKDMLSPTPHLEFDVSNLSDDVTQVVVKKLVPYDDDLLQVILNRIPGNLSEEASAEFEWAEMVRCLRSAKAGHDFVKESEYTEYDTIYDLPVRSCPKSGEYVIEKVLENKVDANLIETLKIRTTALTPLTKTSFDGTTTEELEAGDTLITYDGSAKLKIISIRPAAREMVLQILSSEYVNAVGAGELSEESDLDRVSDYSRLKYFAEPTEKRTLKIPLEEDKYIFIAVAPLNSRLNIQSEWGMGVMINTNNLLYNSVDSGVGFRRYYNENVQNIGDILSELGEIMYPAITGYSQDQMMSMLAAPAITKDHVKVFQINKHLNDSDAIKNIRTLYSQKKRYQSTLSEILDRIGQLNDDISQISFDDLTGTRAAYEAQISDLREQQNNIESSIIKITDQIAEASNNLEVPISNGKFRIRGYIDVEQFVQRFENFNNDEKDPEISESNKKRMLGLVIGTQTRYRYKNTRSPQTNIGTIGDFLFTEWSTYNPPFRKRSLAYDNGKYEINYDDLTSEGNLNIGANVNKFNQIDIPIVQGELVELQSRIIWGFGYPYTCMATDWSNPIEVEFPEEFVTDVQIKSIIEENNSEIESNRFSNILDEKGITQHIADSVNDQDIKYFHRSEDIASGFYTEERRIIPLKDKLQSMSNDILRILDEMQGSASQNLNAVFVVDGVIYSMSPGSQNVVQLPAYNSVKSPDEDIPVGSIYRDGDAVKVVGLITLQNPSSTHSVNIYSMFPGPRATKLTDLKNKKYDTADFTYGNENVKIYRNDIDGELISKDQSANQIITYRTKDPYDAKQYGVFFEPSAKQEAKKIAPLATETDNTDVKNTNSYLRVYPMTLTEDGMCLDSDATNTHYTLYPGDTISFPIAIEYYLTDSAAESFTFGFDLRTSLYTDPTHYKITLVSKYQQTIAEATNSARRSVSTLTKYNTTIR